MLDPLMSPLPAYDFEATLTTTSTLSPVTVIETGPVSSPAYVPA